MPTRLHSLRLRAGSPVARWMFANTRGEQTALLLEQDRAYEVTRVTPQLTRGVMAKKLGTQVWEYLESVLADSIGDPVIPREKCEWCIDSIKSLDQRDEQKQRPRKKAKRSAKRPAKKAARRKVGR